MDSNRTDAPSPARHDDADSDKDFSKPGVDPENAPNVANHRGFDIDKQQDQDQEHGHGIHTDRADSPSQP